MRRRASPPQPEKSINTTFDSSFYSLLYKIHYSFLQVYFSLAQLKECLCIVTVLTTLCFGITLLTRPLPEKQPKTPSKEHQVTPSTSFNPLTKLSYLDTSNPFALSNPPSSPAITSYRVRSNLESLLSYLSPLLRLQCPFVTAL